MKIIGNSNTDTCLFSQKVVLTSHIVQCHLVSTWRLQTLHVYTSRPWLCNSTSMAILENLTRRILENSQCFSLDKFRNTSRPSINSHAMMGSGSSIFVGCSSSFCSRMTKKTCGGGTKKILSHIIRTLSWKVKMIKIAKGEL